MAYHFSGAFQDSIQPTAETGLLAVESGEDVTESARSWLDSHATDDDWLLHVNYWDVHHPYHGINEYFEEVCESGPPASFPDQNAIDDQQGMTGPRTADLWPNPTEYGAECYDEKYSEHSMPERIRSRHHAEHIIDGYDAAIRKVDNEISRLLETLEEADIRDETAIIITSDHGEALGEHGIYADHAFPHPPVQRVPMIVSWPGKTDDRRGAAVDEYIYQFDLMATLCELFDVELPSGWDAEPFTSALTCNDFEGRNTLVCGHGIYTYGRAVYEDGWAYIRLYHPGVFSYPGMYNDPELPNGGLELLHDLENDPNMRDNKITEESEVADKLRKRLDTWLSSHISNDWKEQRPTDARGMDTLVRMSSYGPFLYVDPDDLINLYHTLDRSDEQIAAVERMLQTFPNNDWTN